MEKVNEWSGIGNYYQFKERGQDTRIGRFLSVDPIASKYPWNSSYAFAENRVIDGVDLEGLEFMQTTGNFQLNTYRQPKTKLYSQQFVKGDILIRDAKSHNIAVNMHIPDAALQNAPGYQPQVDYNKPELFEVNENLSKSSQQNQIKNFRGQGGANIALELLNFAEGVSGWSYNEKNKSTITYNYQSAQALGQAVNLVNTTVIGNMLPKTISSNSGMLKDVTNYITDHTLPQGGGSPYDKLISTWGDLIFNNRSKILNGGYNMKPLQLKTKRVGNGLDGFGRDIQYYEGNRDPAVMKANTLLNQNSASIPTNDEKIK